MENKIQFREINGFSGYYAGSDGNLYSNLRKEKIKKEKEYYQIKPKTHNKGYWEYGLYQNKKRIWKTVHQLIAETFLGDKPSDKHEVHHINNDKKDNRPENLQWVTRSENIYHSYHTHGRETKIRPIYYGGKKYISIRALAIENNLIQTSINSTLSKMKKLGKDEIRFKGKILKYATNNKISGPCVLSDWETSLKD